MGKTFNIEKSLKPSVAGRTFSIQPTETTKSTFTPYKVGVKETLKYFPEAVGEMAGGVIEKAKEQINVRGLPLAAFDALASFGEAIATAPFRFVKGVVGIVSPEYAEKIIPESIPHPTELLLNAIGKEEWVKTSKPVHIGLAYQTQHKENIAKGVDPWVSTLMVGSEVLLDGAITGGIAKGLLTGIAGEPAPPESIRARDARTTLEVKRGANPEVIKKAYYEKAHLTHPDKVGGSERAFKKVNISYKTLTGVQPKTTRVSEIARALVKERAFFKGATKPVVPKTPTEVPEVKALKPTKVKPTEVEPAIPKELEPLAKEAKKYKSAEEFEKGVVGKIKELEIKTAEVSKVTKKRLKSSIARRRKEIAFAQERFNTLTDFYTQATKEVKPVVKPTKIEEFEAAPRLPTKYTEEVAKRHKYLENLLKESPEEFTPRMERELLTLDTLEIEAKEVKPVDPSITQNKEYDNIVTKLEKEGSEALSNNELNILSKGQQEIITAEGVKPIDEADSASNKIQELYAGVPLDKLAKLPITIKGTKMKLIDAIGSTFIRYYGLTPEIRRTLVNLEASNDVRKEDLKKFFIEQFPISKDQAKLLTGYQENPAKYPITPELEKYSKIVSELIELSKSMQAERGLQKNFFPDSFIKKAESEITEHEEVIPSLKSEKAITKHQQAIKDLKDYAELLKGLNYIPHLYLQSEEIERNLLKLMPEGRITSKFRSTLSSLKGRKIATLDDAKELGLIPEEDIRVLLATHFEYLFRKTAIYDAIEKLKENPQAVLPEDKAPDNWNRVAISQLSGYKVNPFLVRTIEDFATNSEVGLIGKGYDSVNWLGKSMVFYNPIILNFWDAFQGYAAGTISPWKPIYTARLIWQGAKDTFNESELYKEALSGGLFRTPRAGYYSPPMENSMKIVINKMEKDYPGWKKAIEKITGKGVDWKTYTVIPDLYATNWRITWGGDRIQRMATLRHALNKGMELPDAIDYANNFHANYNIFTRKSKKWINRMFLVPTYKANMIVNLPAYIAKNTFGLAKSIVKGQKPTLVQKAALSSIWRLALLIGTALSFAAWKGYHLREGYRLVKKLEEPEITKEGKVLTERVITLPGPFAEIPKLVARMKTGPKGLFMYMAKVPQIAWSLARNARWNGDPFYTEGASSDFQRKEIMLNLLRDYVAPIDKMYMMTDEEVEAIDNIFTTFGLATYKRGGTERRIFWQINKVKSKLSGFLKKPNVSIEDKKDAQEEAQNKILKLIDELEDYQKLYEK